VNNVIVFPKTKKGTPANSIDEILEKVGDARREHIEMLIDATLANVFSHCYQEGFDLTEDRCVKTTALVVESLRAALYNTCNMEHSLHGFAEQLFVDETQAQAQTERIMESDDPDIA
jgi:hypothetical protein